MAGRGGRERRGGSSAGSSASSSSPSSGRRPSAVRRTTSRANARAAARTPARDTRRPARQTTSSARARRIPFGLSNTRRAGVLAVVVCALALSVAVPLRTYLSQRAEVRVQEQKQAELRAEVDHLLARKAQLDDPEQVKAEARRRLRYVMPGETPYIVELPGDAGGPGAGQQPSSPIPQQAWYQALWESVAGG